MRTAIISLLGLTALSLGIGTAQAADVGFSIAVGQPGFYGQINVGGYPPPELIYGHPVLAEPDYGYPGRPIYLHVPPGWVRHWRWHCAEFRACHRPVYFVRDGWYDNTYVPRFRREHERDWRPGRGDDRRWERGGHGAWGEHGRGDRLRHGDRGGPGQRWGDQDH